MASGNRPSAGGGGGSGNVVGTAPTVVGNLAVFDNLTGTKIKDGGVPGGGGNVSTTDIVAVDDTIVVQNGITGKLYKKSATVLSTLLSSITAKLNINNSAPTGVFAFDGTSSVTGLVNDDVGLGNVDNTSDANKPVSTSQQTALNLKANLAGATYAGTQDYSGATVAGLNSSDVGLGNVDNTSDAGKPVSTAQGTAIGLKVDTLNSELTGVVKVLPTVAPTVGQVLKATNIDGTVTFQDAIPYSSRQSLTLGAIASNDDIETDQPIGTIVGTIDLGSSTLQRVGNLWTMTLFFSTFWDDDPVVLDLTHALATIASTAKIDSVSQFIDSAADDVYINNDNQGAGSETFNDVLHTITIDRNDTIASNSPLKAVITGTVVG